MGGTTRTGMRLAPPAVLALALAGAGGGALGWVLTDRLERDDRFCVSCHLAPGEPLHEAKRSDFLHRPAATLAAAHAAAGAGGTPPRDFRCIDCHGGTGALGRARVKLLSARDAFWYAVGRFEEPESMRWPLLDADCRKCHARFREREQREGREVTQGRDPLFHELAVHNVKLGVSCVECHGAHEPGGLADHDFLHPALVRARCAECHTEFSELQ